MIKLEGIDPKYIQLLDRAGYTKLSDFDGVSAYGLAKIKGIGRVTATRILEAVTKAKAWQEEREKVREETARAIEKEETLIVAPPETEPTNASARVRRLRTLNP